jgi:hypothetical protein
MPGIMTVKSMPNIDDVTWRMHFFTLITLL